MISLLVSCSAAPEQKAPKQTSDFDIQHVEDDFFSGTASLLKLTHLPGYKLTVSDTRTKIKADLHVKYPVYRFDKADINGDGKTDLLLGVIKQTHFEPVLDKRLYILQIDSGRIRPLWLGSRVCLKLIDFKPIQHKGKSQVVTIEQDQKGLYCNGFYEWQNFGLRLLTYKNKQSDYTSADNFFKNETKTS